MHSCEQDYYMTHFLSNANTRFVMQPVQNCIQYTVAVLLSTDTISELALT
jgi:hypothetical protein